MLKKALISCPVAFSEEIVAVLKMSQRQMKMSQIDTENYKNHETYRFSKILHFVQVFDKRCGLER